MDNKEVRLPNLKWLVIWLGIMTGLVVALAFTESQVEAAPNNLGSNLPIKKVLPLESIYYAGNLRVDPPMPTPNDVIRITASGESPNGCVPHYQSHRVEGNRIRIDATGNLYGVCVALWMPVTWSFGIEVGPLPVGFYTIELYILDPIIGPVRYTTTSFLVTTERLYLPIIRRNY